MDSTRLLSNDLLSILKKAATSHQSTSHQRNALSLLQDHINGVDRMELITQGKGFEMYQLRIKSGFSRGLGTEAISNLTEYVLAVHQSQESIGAFFDRMSQLYNQVQLTKGCSIGETAQKLFTLDGLCKGAYHEVLGPWVKKTLIGQGQIKLETATMATLQHGATDLLATSSFYKGNVLAPGKLPRPITPAACAATNGETSTKDQPSPDAIVESIVKHICGGYPLKHAQTTWIRNKYTCPHCHSNSHSFASCRGIARKWVVTAAAPSPAGRPLVGGTSARRSAGNRHQPEITNGMTPPPPPTNPYLQPPPIPDPKAQVAVHTHSHSGTEQGEEGDSKTYESYDTFTYLGYDSDPKLLLALTEQVARKTADDDRIRFLNSNLTTVARVAQKEVRWVDERNTVHAVEGNSSNLAIPSTAYHARKARKANPSPIRSANSTRNCSQRYPCTVCPDSGATSIMGPHRDMFLDYTDVRGQGLVVRLGDEDQTIPIAGRGTLCLDILGHKVA
jgi:hypothetical protein